MLMFYKGLNPMLVRMTAYYRRHDRRALMASRQDVEAIIMRTAAAVPVVAEPAEEG